MYDLAESLLEDDAQPSGIDRTSPRDQAMTVLRRAINETFQGRIAVVSSFGAESAVLLALVASIDRSVPVIFLDTKQQFEETLAYRDSLARHLRLLDVRDVTPDASDRQAADPQDQLWYFDPDACCKLRKVTPLAGALTPFDAWITGRKRHQAGTRAHLPLVETAAGRSKINPLAAWTPDDLEAAFVAFDLPRHPLVAEGYRSIGCAPCTRPTSGSQDARLGRWAGASKTECGIHA